MMPESDNGSVHAEKKGPRDRKPSDGNVRRDRAKAQQSGFAIGIIFTAAFILIYAGFWHGSRISGLVNNEFYLVTQQRVFQFDTTWGWIHIIVGLIALGTGFRPVRGPGLRADRRRHGGVPEHGRQLPLAPVLPVAGIGTGRRASRAPDDQSGRCRDHTAASRPHDPTNPVQLPQVAFS